MYMRILIIEDEKKIAQAIAKGLSQEGFAVDVEHDSDDGLAMAQAEPYDLFIIDRMLPGRYEGIEICEILREKNIHSPIIILTAKEKTEDKVAGLNAGADDYLSKPFAFEELLARVQALLRRPSKALNTKLSYEDLELNATNYEVTRNGKKIELSKKEFALLEYLMRNPGQTLPRETIISHVWNFDADILQNTLEVYIGYLRAKVDKGHKQKLIHTVRGFGYKFGTI